MSKLEQDLREQINAAHEFVMRHPALSLIDLAEFRAFLKVPAAFEAAMQGTSLQEIDAAAIREFENDLRDMSAEEMRRELDAITDTIDSDTAWQEALAAALRRNASE